jgi:ribosomal protein L3 glutamine methyltransferase
VNRQVQRSEGSPAAKEFRTIRDLARYAVSKFNACGLTYGHGTSSAVDEAAFLILEALQLPIDDINPWLDARLLAAEREHVLALIERRVSSRKPAAYLLSKAYIQGIPFYIDERVIVPRSYIGELLLGPDPIVGEGRLVGPAGGLRRILDLCCGSACLAILAARTFPEARIDAVDLSADALAVARRNVTEHGLGDRIELLEGDLFAPLSGRRYDLILANPPYVTAADVAAFPPEYQAEPQIAHLGGDDGLDVVLRIIRGARSHLEEHGSLICEVGTGRARLEQHLAMDGAIWLDSADSRSEVFWIPGRSLPGRKARVGRPGHSRAAPSRPAVPKRRT